MGESSAWDCGGPDGHAVTVSPIDHDVLKTKRRLANRVEIKDSNEFRCDLIDATRHALLPIDHLKHDSIFCVIGLHQIHTTMAEIEKEMLSNDIGQERVVSLEDAPLLGTAVNQIDDSPVGIESISCACCISLYIHDDLFGWVFPVVLTVACAMHGFSSLWHAPHVWLLKCHLALAGWCHRCANPACGGHTTYVATT